MTKKNAWIVFFRTLTASMVLVLVLASWQINRQRTEIVQLRTELFKAQTRIVVTASQNGSLASRVKEAATQAKVLTDFLTEENLSLTTDRRTNRKEITPQQDGAKAISMVKHWVDLSNDPEVMKSLNLQQRGQIQRRYGGLFKQLELTTAQSDQLTKIMIDKKQAPIDLAVVAVEKGKDPASDPIGFQQDVLAARTNMENEIKSLLGDDNYAQYREYIQAQGQTTILTQLEQALHYTDTPLSNEQAEALKQLMQKQKIGHLSDYVVSNAKTFLQPAQMQSLLDLWQERQTIAQQQNTQQNMIGSLAIPHP